MKIDCWSFFNLSLICSKSIWNWCSISLSTQRLKINSLTISNTMQLRRDTVLLFSMHWISLTLTEIGQWSLWSLLCTYSKSLNTQIFLKFKLFISRLIEMLLIRLSRAFALYLQQELIFGKCRHKKTTNLWRIWPT